MKTVNLIYYNNGVGMSKHAIIIESVLKNFFNINHVHTETETCPSSDINIFIQNIDENNIEFIFCSNINILIPCIEWMHPFSIKNIKLFDIIFATTEECYNLLKPLHSNVIKMGFSSIDRYNPNIIKKPTFFHNCGKSIQKNTELVVDVFNENKLPITIVDATSRFIGKTKQNINYIPKFLNENEITELYNQNLFHICCSINEGWGHYIYESLSCKSVLITTNAPPMNENLTNKECFFIKCHSNVDYPNSDFVKNVSKFPLRKLNYVVREELEHCINSIKYKSFEELQNNARKKYESISQNFNVNFKQFILSL